MDKNRLQEKEEIEFLEIGKQKEDKEEIIDRPIIFDKKQYSIKFPKKIIEAIEYKEGDYLRLTLIKPLDVNKKPYIKIEYKRKQ